MSAILSHHEADILERAIDASSENWSPAMAKGFLSIKLTASDVARMNELVAKAQTGSLDADEELEIESYKSATRVLEILKLRARAALKAADLTNPPSP